LDDWKRDEELETWTADRVTESLAEHRHARQFYDDEEMRSALDGPSVAVLRQMQALRFVHARKVRKKGRGTKRAWPIRQVFKARLAIDLSADWDISMPAACEILRIVPTATIEMISDTFALEVLILAGVRTGVVTEAKAKKDWPQGNYATGLDGLRGSHDAEIAMMDRKQLTLKNGYVEFQGFIPSEVTIGDIDSLVGTRPRIVPTDTAESQLGDFVSKMTFNLSACMRRFKTKELADEKGNLRR
jgi:hypothetical protein